MRAYAATCRARGPGPVMVNSGAIVFDSIWPSVGQLHPMSSLVLSVGSKIWRSMGRAVKGDGQ